MAGHAEQEKVEQALAILNIAGSGPSLENAVLRALAEPGLFVYGELVELPSMQQVCAMPRIMPCCRSNCHAEDNQTGRSRVPPRARAS